MPSLRWWSEFHLFGSYLRHNKHRASIKFDDANQMAPRFLFASRQVSIPFLELPYVYVFSNQLLLPPPSATCYNESSNWLLFLSLRFCNFFLLIFFSCKTKDHLSFLMGFSRLLIKLMGYWKGQLAIIHYFSEKEIITTGRIETQSSAAR
jgi:hypothetical protein